MMGDKQMIATHSPAFGRVKFAFVALVALSFLFAESFQLPHRAKNKKNPAYARIKLSTNPGGYPVLIDDQPAGNTTVSERLLDLPAGPHKVEIIFPNGERWTRGLGISGGRRF